MLTFTVLPHCGIISLTHDLIPLQVTLCLILTLGQLNRPSPTPEILVTNREQFVTTFTTLVCCGTGSNPIPPSQLTLFLLLYRAGLVCCGTGSNPIPPSQLTLFLLQGYCWLKNDKGHFEKTLVQKRNCLSLYIIKRAHTFQMKGPF